jgi:acyl-CoA dehydrogenase-like protein
VSTATITDSADFYALEDLFDAGEQAYLHSGRDVMASAVEPTVNRHWQRGSFPFEIVPGFRQLGLAGLPYHGFGCPGKSFLLDGMVTMELARTDPSIATFAAVHGGLAMGSVRQRGPKTALPAGDGALREDRRLRADRTRRRLGRFAGPDDNRPPRRRFVGSDRPEEMDRQRHLRRSHRHLGWYEVGGHTERLSGRGDGY